MKRLFLLLPSLFICINLSAQDLPTIVPPSPEATSLAKFTEIPISHYTGLPNINIPFFTIKEDGLKIPINLSYHSRGIKVEEISPRVGLGWALNYGGQITRQIRGKADEDRYGYFDNSLVFKDVFTDIDVRTGLVSDYANHPDMDFYPDQFIFDANGINGKFIFDYTDKMPIIQKHEDIKIELIENEPSANFELSGFIITDKNGIKFYFGLSKDKTRKAISYDSTIESSRYTIPGDSYERISMGEDSFPNTWQLMEIQTPNGKSIEFFYNDDPETPIFWRRSFDVIERDVSNGISSEKKIRSYFSKIQSFQYQLKEIRFSEGKVLFTSSIEREDLSGAFTLDKIELQNNYGKIIKSYILNYQYKATVEDNNQLWYLKSIDPRASKRLFLKKITEVGGNNELPPYEFFYNDDSLMPNRFSNSQDLWGYYNGANNGSFLTFHGYNSIVVNREVNTNKSYLGILKEIKYPTGGKTKFIQEDNITQKSFINRDLIYSDPNQKELKKIILTKDSFVYNEFDGFTPLKITLPKNVKSIRINCIHFRNFDDTTTPDCIFKFSASKNGGVSYYPLNIDEELNYGGLGNTDLYFHISAMNITDENNNLLFLKPQYDFSIEITYEVEVNISNDNEIYAGGKRIKRIENYDSNGNILNFKEYEYKKPSGELSGEILSLPNYYTKLPAFENSNFTVFHRWGNTGGSPLSTPNGNTLGYSYVTEYYGDKNTNNGKTEFEFSLIYDSGSYTDFPYNLPNDHEWLRGLNLSTKYFSKIDNNYTLIKKIENEYVYADKIYEPDYESYYTIFYSTPTYLPLDRNVDLLNPLLAYYKDKRLTKLPLIRFTSGAYLNTDHDFIYGDIDFVYDVNHYYYKIYQLTAGTLDLLESTTTDYFKNLTEVSTKTRYGYNYDKHYQVAKTESFDSKGDILINKILYPNNKSEIINLTPNALLAIDKLRNQHKIAQPIQSETYMDINNNGDPEANELLSTQRTNFKEWNTEIILPEIIQTSKGTNPLEDRIIFHDYYPNGDVKEVSKANGPHIVYIWGYQQTQPIAKIENATYAEIASALGITITVLDTYNESNLVELNALRSSLPNAMVTTYTYDPLIGVTSITDPKGEAIYYHYDNFNRLEYVKDAQGNILSKNEYRYKGQL